MTTQEPPPQARPEPLGRPAPVEPIAVGTRTIIGVGIAAWSLALLVTLVVPSLHTGGRSWWPWTCVAGILLGAFGLWFVSRGRGNAAGA